MTSTSLGYVDETTAHIPCPTCKQYVDCRVNVTFLPGESGEVRSATTVDDGPLVNHVFRAHGPPDPFDDES
jgi:hypothetical protein